ncbi:TIGR02452 family protein [Myceligenerans sp. I2]|uniref:TIGR02452 family protein n=2 Tax=Myceligenerans indicum TaxID=2593663 RepID=A0ABS1LN87_9MICO|nr:TIGR02452 family protein [Myceligenerans indicum]
MDIIERGTYRLDGREVEIGPALTRAAADTRLVLPGDTVAPPEPAPAPARIEVTGETSLEAARRLGPGAACLVFASARNPGGGFLNGAQAQEEALARSSGLYACQNTVPEFYDHHRGEQSLLYSDRVIVSPSVPVFRDDAGALLPEPYAVTFLTAAAPNRGAVERNAPQDAAQVPSALARRAARVLDVAAGHGLRRLVLGAWGCGVFGNDPHEVAGAFAGALRTRPWFTHVTFATFDPRPGRPVLRAFEEVLG